MKSPHKSQMEAARRWNFSTAGEICQLLLLACGLLSPLLLPHSVRGQTFFSPARHMLAQAEQAAEADPADEETSAQDNRQPLRLTQEEIEAGSSPTKEEAGEKKQSENKPAEEPATEPIPPSVEAEKQAEIVSREIELRTQLGYIQDQIKSSQKREEQLQANIAEEQANLTALRTTGPKEEKPYSFLLLEQLRDELAVEELRQERIEIVLSEAKAAREQAKTLADEKQSARRKQKEKLDINQVDTASSDLATTLQLAELEAELAQETFKLRDLELQIITEQQELHDLRETYLREKLQIIQDDVQFTREDLQEQKLQLEQQQEDLNQALADAQRRAKELEQRWAAVSRQLENQTENDPVLVERRDTYRIGQQLKTQEVALLSAQLQRLSRAMTVWEERYEISREEATLTEQLEWQEDAQEKLEQLEREDRLQTIRQEELRQELTTLENKLQTQQNAPQGVVDAIREKRSFLDNQLQVFEANQASIKASKRLHEKLLSELVGDATGFDLQQWLVKVWGHITDAWEYELTVVDERPITVGKIISGMILLLLGILMSRWLSSLFARRFLPRFGMSAYAIPAFQAVSFYSLVAIFTLIALQMVNVPLGVLTFLGGAAAIGLGFGSQNILNNFISGLILLAERPIRVGDIIEMDGLLGQVERIGGRSTRIRNFSNQEIIVPNSTLLQSNVVNWALGAKNIRTQINVGVAYGSPMREVLRLVRKAADDHGQVLQDPEPLVLFTGFGDSSLNVVMYVWVPIEVLSERLRIESDLRLMIDSAFREFKITIPFPQRDLHFDANEPLKVKMVAEEAEEAAKKLAEKRSSGS